MSKILSGPEVETLEKQEEFQYVYLSASTYFSSTGAKDDSMV
jgi:hypothetical protein